MAVDSLAETVLYLGVTYAIVSVPFVFSRVVVCLALTRFPAQLSRLYAADLAGSAIGCLGLVARTLRFDFLAARREM